MRGMYANFRMHVRCPHSALPPCTALQAALSSSALFLVLRYLLSDEVQLCWFRTLCCAGSVKGASGLADCLGLAKQSLGLNSR